MRATCLAYPIILDFITLIIIDLIKLFQGQMKNVIYKLRSLTSKTVIEI